MDLAKTNPEFSPFQQVLVRGIHDQILLEKDLERIKSEGSSLVLVTAERFFRASAREESYLYAVRLIDTILSYQLAKPSSDATLKLKMISLSDIVREGVVELRKLNELPDGDNLPREKSQEDILTKPIYMAQKIRTSTADSLKLVKEETVRRRWSEQAILLAEFFINRVKGHIDDFECQTASQVCNAEFLAIIYKLKFGPYLTKKQLYKIAKMKRPSFSEVKSVLQKHQALLPQKLYEAYNEAVNLFFGSKEIIDFFCNKADIAVLINSSSCIYYAEKNADIFDVESD